MEIDNIIVRRENFDGQDIFLFLTADNQWSSESDNVSLFNDEFANAFVEKWNIETQESVAVLFKYSLLSEL